MKPKVQVIYVLIASPDDLFLQEIWASVYSLRLYEPNREVRILCDIATSNYIKKYQSFVNLITEIIEVEMPDEYNTKSRTRELKTSVRLHIEGAFLFVDTDTIFAGDLSYIDSLSCDIAAVYEYNVPLSRSIFKESVYNTMMNTFNLDVSEFDCWYNSGVIYVSDSLKAYDFYRQWNSNWRFSNFKVGMSQDEPAFMKTNIDMSFLIDQLPNEYNSQPCMNVRYLHKAHIIHYLHVFFPNSQDYCPFFNKRINTLIKDKGYISENISEMIKNCKSQYADLSIVVGERTTRFLASPAASIFEDVYLNGGVASWLMLKFAALLKKIHDLTRRKK